MEENISHLERNGEKGKTKGLQEKEKDMEGKS